MCTSMPVSFWIRVSSPRSRAPPPESMMPRSMISLESSGGVHSSVSLMASTMRIRFSFIASRTSSERIRISFGRPSTRLRPLISIVVSPCSVSVGSGGQAEPISSLICSAVRSPTSRLYLRLIKLVMLWSSASPAQRTLRDATMPERLITATSAVPPPISTIMLPTGSAVGSPAPMAAAIGSSITVTWRAPALAAAWRTARRSTSVTPDGTQMTTRGRTNRRLPHAWRIKLCSMAAVMSKSAITPSFSGRTAKIELGAAPMMALASWPTQRTRSSSVRASTATTLGSRMIMPRPFIYTSVLAVPRSMPISQVNILRRASSSCKIGFAIFISPSCVCAGGPHKECARHAAAARPLRHCRYSAPAWRSTCARRCTGRPIIL